MSQATRASRWCEALRSGQELSWTGAPPPGWTPAEVGPLVDHADDPALESWLPPQGSRGAGRPAVTVVVPTHRCIPWGMDALRQQSWPTEILVVSNGGGPREVDGARVWRTEWQGHGGTRSAALDRVDSPLVLFLSDDAIPRGHGFVEALATALLEGEAEAVVARQIPWPDADRTTRRRLRRWTPATGGAMPQADHVASLYRTDALRRWVREPVAIAEDLAWTRGRRVRCVAQAPVLHSHRREAATLFRRMRAEHRVRAQLGAELPVPGLRELVRQGPAAVYGALREHPSDLWNRLAELAGMGLGAREGRRGRRAASPSVGPLGASGTQGRSE